MKKFAMWLVTWATLINSYAQPGTDIPAMLDQVLPAVVMVGFKTVNYPPKPYGFAADELPLAYRRALDITGLSGEGSGFIIQHQGLFYVITNAHVIQQAASDQDLVVITINGTRYPVRVVGGDSFYDLAVLVFTDKPGNEIKSLSFRQEMLRVGEAVYAVGNPQGTFPYSVSEGIIGGLNRVFNTPTNKFGYLQSTAAISPGNSGGPLVDSTGQVVGINTLGIGGQFNFALEASLAQRLVKDILTNQGRVRRAFLGVEIAEHQSHPPGQPALRPTPPVLVSVMPGSPAAAVLSGKEGSRIVRVNASETRNLEEVLGALEDVVPNGEVTLDLQDQRGRLDQVTLKSTELTLERLSELATYVFLQYCSGQIRENRGVRMQAKKCIPNKIDTYEYDNAQQKFSRPRAVDSIDDIIVAAGIFNPQQPFLWRVRSLADLGVAVRLSAPQGYIDLVAGSENSEYFLRLHLKSDMNTVARTLLY